MNITADIQYLQAVVGSSYLSVFFQGQVSI